MDFIESFQLIVKKEKIKEIIPFLQNLSPEQRRLLAPKIISLEKEYSEIIQVGNTWKSRQTQLRRLIFIYASIVCLNRKEFSRGRGLWALNPEHLSEILPWFVPSWLGDFINTESQKGLVPHGLNYDFIMKLAAAGHIQPAPDLLASTLVPSIFELKNKEWRFIPENLLQYPETLSTHIWYLFSYETRIWVNDNYFVFAGYEKGKSPTWIDAFLLQIRDGRLDRMKLIQETLLAANRNFSKNLSNWFADLVIALKPTKPELLQLQPELFSLLNAPLSKPVGTSLGMLKRIAGEDGFEYKNFLEYLPVLAASPVKTNIAACLSISESIWKKDKSLAGEIAPLICGVLIHRDEAVQSRTAKLLLKFLKTETLDLVDILASYSQTLLAGPRTLLRPLMSKDPLVVSQPDRDKIQTLQEENQSFKEPVGLSQEDNPKLHKPNDWTHEEDESSNEDRIFLQRDGVLAQGDERILQQPAKSARALPVPIPPIETFEDFVFLMSQALDNNESWHLDQAAAGFIRFQSELDAEKITRLLPAFQRAWKLLISGWASGTGYLDNMFAYFMIDVGMVIIKSQPEKAMPLRQLFDQSMAKAEIWQQQWYEHGTNLSFFESEGLKTKERFYEPYKKFLDMVLDRLRRNVNAPLLSTPTHAPGWLDPNIFIERLLVYEQMNIAPEDIDLQLAISRCGLHMATTEIATALESLSSRYRELLAFLFGQDVPDAFGKQSQVSWVMAAITKDPASVASAVEAGPYKDVNPAILSGQYPWKASVEEYKASIIEYIATGFRTTYHPATRKVLRLQTREGRTPDVSPEKPGVLKGLFNKILKSVEKSLTVVATEQLIYQYFILNSHSDMGIGNDARRLIMMIPNNPEPFIAVVINKCLVTDSFGGEEEKKLAIGVLQAILDLAHRHTETSLVFVAGCMSGNDKTVASYATEVWMKAVVDNSISSERLGHILGSLYAIEYAPLKRFTDLVINQFLNVSPLHNQQLDIMLASLIMQLPVTPVRGLKKLLEVFFEVISADQPVRRIGRDRGIITLLDRWQETAGLQKIVSRLKSSYENGK